MHPIEAKHLYKAIERPTSIEALQQTEQRKNSIYIIFICDLYTYRSTDRKCKCKRDYHSKLKYIYKSKYRVGLAPRKRMSKMI